MKDNIFILDILSAYTFIFPIVWLTFAISTLLFKVNTNVIFYFEITLVSGFYLYIVVQCLALILLLYVLAKKWKL